MLTPSEDTVVSVSDQTKPKRRTSSSCHRSTRSDVTDLDIIPLSSRHGRHEPGVDEESSPERGGDEKDEKVILDTLGEGPSAPKAAAEVAEDVQMGAHGVEPGLKGWMNLIGVMSINGICYGMTNSWGTFQDYYLTHELSNYSQAQVSWIGSIQLCLCPLLGCFAGPLFDSGYLKYLTIAGGFIYTFAFMMSSISKEYYQFLLAHGFGVGLGMGIIFSPSVSTLAHHFGKSKYRSMAYGLQACGSCLGGIVFPNLARSLLPSVGLGWTLRIFGFIVLGIVVQSYFTLSTTVPPRKKVAILSPSVFQTTGYSIHVLGCCLCSLTVYCPLTFAVTYGKSHGISTALSNTALSIINAASIVGRLLPLMLAQKVGAINVLSTSGLVTGVMLFVWTKATSVPGIITYDALYGVASGGYAAGVNPAAASFAPQTNQTGLYLGMFFFVTSFFWLGGTPATAALINGTDYFKASMFCGSTLTLGVALILVGRWQRVKAVGTPWV